MSGYHGAALTPVDFLQIVDIRTKIVSLSSLLVGSGWALATAPERFSWGLFALMAVATLAIDMGTTGFNSYFDFLKGVDTRESDQERFKALVQRDLDPRRALHLSLVLYGLSMPLGILIGLRAGWEVVAIGAACMVFAYFYSGGLKPISATPVGEFFAGGLLGGVLVVVAAYIHTRQLDGATVAVGVPSSLIIAAILSANNACDQVGDARAGRHTLALALGPKRAHWPVLVLVALAFAAVAALGIFGVMRPLALAPMLVAAVFAWKTLAAMNARGWSHATKGPNMGAISLVFVAFTLCLLAGFAIGT